eukprot:TRINITY_DN102640_c0_g1_i1.p1 TRINITY_DN102640_c0_g1~~TRINITY_DN102640_c0_g1_i1.p1  ORF type:complete len:741 (+),score=108.03 TRINITY_DN102640_c0_g1_i1:53-2275(+)
MLPLSVVREHGAVVSGTAETTQGRTVILRHFGKPQKQRTSWTLLAAGTAASAVQVVSHWHRRKRACASRGYVALASNPEQHEVTWIDGISDICDRYDAFILDLWGVVHNGAVAFPWAVKALEELKARGKPVVFLSNSSRRTSTNFATLERLGISRDLYVDMITSGEEAFHLLTAGKEASSLPSGMQQAQKLLTFGNNSDDVKYLEGLVPRSGSPPEEAELILARGCASMCTSGCDVRKADWDDIEAALSVLAERNVPMIVANPDSVRPDGDDSPMPGRIAARYVELGGPAPYFVGKPYPDVFESALSCHISAGLSKDARVCMIGDSAWHDVRGARRIGLDVVLLSSGVHAKALGVPQAPTRPSRPSIERSEAFLGALSHEEAPTYFTTAMSWQDPTSGVPAVAARKSPRVITCGLACVDILLSIDKFPEPDDKVRTEDCAWLGGGNAANTACALARLGTPTAILSMVGNDAMGKGIINELKADGVITDAIVLAPDSPSACTSILVDQQTVTRTCINTPMSRDMKTEEALAQLDALFGHEHSEEAKLLHLDCRHPDAAVALAGAVRHRQNVLITMDAERPRPGLEELLQLSDVIFCNSRFPALWTGESGVPAGLQAILDRCPRARFVVMTRGERGSMLMCRASEIDNLQADALKGLPVTCCQGSYGDYLTLTCDAWPLSSEILDSTGAGDVFIAGFLHALVERKPFSVAMATGAYTATQKLSRLGARLGPAFDRPTFASEA